MKRCVMSVVSEPFVFGAIAMMASFRRKNPFFKDPFVILWNSENAPLSASSRDLIAREVDNVVFHEVDNQVYEPIFYFAENVVQTPKRLRAAFYILEAFRSDYDYVVTLDSDMIILGDVSVLFEIEQPFAAVRAYDHVKDLYLPYFNTGTMVVRRNCPDSIVFDDIVSALNVTEVNRNHGKADQAVLNIALQDHDKFYISDRYNFSKRIIPVDERDPAAFLINRDVRILHYLGEKPWNVKVKANEWQYRRIEALWWTAINQGASKATLRRLQAAYIRQVDLLNKVVLDRLSGAPLGRKDELAIEAAFIDKIF